MTKSMTKSRAQNVRGVILHSCDVLSNSSGSRPPKKIVKKYSRSKTEIEAGDTSKVKPGADLFNGHQTGIGQFGENQCKFIHQVERCAHCITLLASLQYCAVCTQCMYPIWHCALYTA